MKQKIRKVKKNFIKIYFVLINMLFYNILIWELENIVLKRAKLMKILIIKKRLTKYNKLIINNYKE